MRGSVSRNFLTWCGFERRVAGSYKWTEGPLALDGTPRKSLLWRVLSHGQLEYKQTLPTAVADVLVSKAGHNQPGTFNVWPPTLDAMTHTVAAFANEEPSGGSPPMLIFPNWTVTEEGKRSGIGSFSAAPFIVGRSHSLWVRPLVHVSVAPQPTRRPSSGFGSRLHLAIVSSNACFI